MNGTHTNHQDQITNSNQPEQFELSIKQEQFELLKHTVHSQYTTNCLLFHGITMGGLVMCVSKMVPIANNSPFVFIVGICSIQGIFSKLIKSHYIR
jgi:hypothetical protein